MRFDRSCELFNSFTFSSLFQIQKSVKIKRQIQLLSSLVHLPPFEVFSDFIFGKQQLFERTIAECCCDQEDTDINVDDEDEDDDNVAGVEDDDVAGADSTQTAHIYLLSDNLGEPNNVYGGQSKHSYFIRLKEHAKAMQHSLNSDRKRRFASVFGRANARHAADINFAKRLKSKKQNHFFHVYIRVPTETRLLFESCLNLALKHSGIANVHNTHILSLPKFSTTPTITNALVCFFCSIC